MQDKTIAAITIAVGPVGPETKGNLPLKMPEVRERIIAPQIPAGAPIPDATPNAKACGKAMIDAMIPPNKSPLKIEHFSFKSFLIFSIF